MSEFTGWELFDEEDLQTVICRSCEVEYMIVLAEDMLAATIEYCSFCGEVIPES